MVISGTEVIYPSIVLASERLFCHHVSTHTFDTSFKCISYMDSYHSVISRVPDIKYQTWTLHKVGVDNAGTGEEARQRVQRPEGGWNHGYMVHASLCPKVSRFLALYLTPIPSPTPWHSMRWQSSTWQLPAGTRVHLIKMRWQYTPGLGALVERK